MADIGQGEPVTQSVLAAARAGRLQMLVAVRDLIARELDDGVPPRDMASLTKRLSEVSAEVEKIQGGESEGADVHVADQAFRPEAV